MIIGAKVILRMCAMITVNVETNRNEVDVERC